MTNAKEEILELLEKESIEAIRLGQKGWDYNDKPPRQYSTAREIEEALRILDFEFSDGFGSENGYSLWVWSKSWIITKGCYDGSEWYTRIPRNPNVALDMLPESIGD